MPFLSLLLIIRADVILLTAFKRNKSTPIKILPAQKMKDDSAFSAFGNEPELPPSEK